MMWVLLFVGIAVLAVVVHGVLGVWLWRRASALFGEIDRANEAIEQLLASETETAERGGADSEDGRLNVPVG